MDGTIRITSGNGIIANVYVELMKMIVDNQWNVPSLAAKRGDWSAWDGVLYDIDELPKTHTTKIDFRMLKMLE